MDSEIKQLLESLQEGEESPVMDLSSDIWLTKLSLSEEQSSRKGVLCTLEGIGMGPFNEDNRNERDYPSEVATVGILNSSYTKEMMKCKTLLGEPHHPKDRNEIWCDCTSHCVTDMWMSEDNRYLMIRIDVLDTPNGRILKTLCDYGCSLGISARASGKTKKVKGRLVVVPEYYKFKTFDVVTNPGFMDARLHNVNEEVEDKVSLKEGLERLMESADLDTLKSVRSLIEYCEDTDVKALLPLVESRLEKSDNSDGESDYPEDLIEEMANEIAELRGREVEYKTKISLLTSQVAYLRESQSKSGNDHEEVLSEGVINLKRALVIKEENLQSVHEENLELKLRLDESQSLVEELQGTVEDLTESRGVAVASLKKYRALNEELQENISSLTEETDIESVEVPVVRRRKVGIGGVVSTARSISLNEENEGNSQRIGLIRKVGGK